MLETIRIKSTHPETQGEFVIINMDDFDAEKHEPFDPAVHEALDPVEMAAEAVPHSSDDAQAAPARRGRKAKAE